MKAAALVSPHRLFALLRAELPDDLLEHVFVIGSLAAAYHFSHRMQLGGVKTKDADLVIHPAGNTVTAQEIARRLLHAGWLEVTPRAREPGTAETPAQDTPAIRLRPPGDDSYFVELLIVANGQHPGAKPWFSVELDEGWYGLPSFEFLALTTQVRLVGGNGLEYANPAMMALANLLSHRTLAHHVMSTPVGGRGVQRYAKDLGRVLALARLSSVDELDHWPELWAAATRTCFPDREAELVTTVGDGLRALLTEPVGFEQAWHCCTVSLLANLGVTENQLRAVAQQVLQLTDMLTSTTPE